MSKTTDIVRRTFGFRARAETLDEVARSIRVIASTAAIDSYDEIVEQSWNLDRYSRNPVVLYHHNAAGGFFGGSAVETLPIGHASRVGVVDGQLEATLHFVTAEANPMAEMVWQGVRQGSLRAVSVGFYPHTVVSEKVNDSDRFVLKDNELFEISVVPLPANPEAVALGAETRGEQLRRLAARDNCAAQGGLEKSNMTEAELQAERDAAQAAKDAAATETRAALEMAAKAEAERNEALAKIAELEAAKTLADANAAAQAERVAQLSAEVNRSEVVKLLGKSIYPAELEPMVALRAANPELFAALVAARPPIDLSTDITGNDTPDSLITADPESKLAALVRDAGKDH